MPRQLRREEYTVGWVCALPVELAAAQEILDEEHSTPPYDAHDTTLYTCGRIGDHNVVIACLPEGQQGTNSAAAVAMQMKSTFSSTRFGLMVGIGGGVPSEEADVRLGDVVVSKPHKTYGGVVQYDSGKATASGFERTGALNAPPTVLLNAIASLQAKQMRRKDKLLEYLAKLNSLPVFSREAAGSDHLFKAEYSHVGGATCGKCSIEQEAIREARIQNVMMHYGTIASGNQVIQDAAVRDRLSEELGGVLCFETEAAGLMNSFPCLVIRGICDYADSHKNMQWQPYAAGTAAAYAKDLLSVIPVAEVKETCRVEDAMSGASKRCLQSASPDSASYKRRKPDSVSSTNVFAEQQTVTLPIHYQDHDQVSLNDEQRQSLFESLKFEQINARQMTIKTAHAKTCRWLLNHALYLAWLDTTKLTEHHGFLWIKGNAGTGKSTLMKFAWAHARRKMKGHIVLSFFFNARGEEIERSTCGTYRSLLLQLLERLPALRNVFDSLGLSTSSLGTDHQWSTEPLKTLLEQAMQALGEHSVVCFIDALDECDQEQIREMVQFFEHIGDLAVSKGIRFQVCFSSRHYPYITIRNGLELVLDGQEGHTQDITHYIETELKIGKSKVAQQIRAELQEKASGIFMWVILVVGILNKESDRGQVHTLRRKLQEIPSDLHKLFRDILTRDTHNKEGLILCIQWVLFAKQPLSPEQLYHAILSGIDFEAVSEWDPEEITKDVIKRFILDSSKGLAEITVSKEQRVQFIHESVRDFLLKENGLGQIWPEFKANFQGQSHDRLKQCCLDYMNVDISTPLKITGDLPKASSQQAAGLRKSAAEIYPFLEYAVHNVLYHADTAESGGVSQAGFLDSFPRPQWIKLHNLFGKHDVRRHTENVSLLYVLAERNAAHLIRIHPSASACLDVEDERYGCAFFAANATGGQEAMQACIESLKIGQAESKYGRRWPEGNSREEKTEGSLGRNFKYSKKRGMLSCAAEIGNVAVLGYLIDLGKWDIDSKDTKGRTPLYVAAQRGTGVSIQELLDKGADINTQCGEYGNALQAASAGGYKEVMMLLLDKGADVNLQGGYHGNALQVASFGNHKEVVTLLLDKGADANAQGGEYGNALQAASARGHKEVVTLLLDKGADINAQGGHYGNALKAALTRGHKEVAILLLDKGADVNAQGGEYGNALQAASAGGHKEVATLLLDKGADINAQGGPYGNALQAASARGHKEVAMLLLDKGADINAQGGLYGNALEAASAGGHKEVAMLLIKKGASDMPR